jgi:hypothetical protein
MKTPFLTRLAGAAALACLFSTASSAQPVKHDFLALDEGLMNVMHVNEANPKQNWLVHVGHALPRDMQLEGGGRLLISHDQGYCEYDIATGKLLKDVALYHDVSSVRRLPNGDLILAGVDFDGKKLNRGHDPVGDPAGRHVLFVEYAPDGSVVKRTTYVGDYLRLVRQTPKGTFLCACNTLFREADGNGNWIRDIPVEGFHHAWLALSLPNGDTLMSAGFGTSETDKKSGSSFMVEVDPSGAILRKFGARDQVPAGVKPYFYAMFQLLPNGDVVVANWHGHSGGHNYEGEQIVEFDPKGAIVWHWGDQAFVSSLQGVLVLDGLNTAQLYDERNGTMEPLASENPAPAALPKQ